MKSWHLLKTFGIAVAVMSGFIMTLNTAQAVVLPDNTPQPPGPGVPTNGVAFPVTFGQGIVTPLVSDWTDSVSGAMGTIESRVFDGSGVLSGPKGLLFAYQVVNNGGGIKDINGVEFLSDLIRVQLNGFPSPITTDVDWANDVGPAALQQSYSADRFGGYVAFDFQDDVTPDPNTSVAPGERSRWFFVQTDLTGAPSPAISTASVFAIGGQESPAIYAAVPEPTTALFGIALTGVVAFVRRRR
jgi:hypothetical protein